MQQKIRNWHKEHHASLTFGERAADKMRNGMGSWNFVFLFIVFMCLWAWVNTHGDWHHWDVYPFILLNLFLSMLAGLQGAILLIAAKRADSISAAMAENDYRTNVEAAENIEQLKQLNEQQTALLQALTDRLDGLEQAVKDRT